MHAVNRILPPKVGGPLVHHLGLVGSHAMTSSIGRFSPSCRQGCVVKPIYVLREVADVSCELVGMQCLRSRTQSVTPR